MLDDGQITRGGEIEKRKVFSDEGSLLAETLALASGKIGASTTPTLIVFGSVSPPAGLPAGVVYQRLQHPDGGFQLEDIADWTLYDGKVYVVGEFSDGSQWHFYDGLLVTDWGAGVVRPSMTTNELIAEHLKNLVDASDSYSATRTGASIIITGQAGVDYAVAVETQDGGGINNQNLTANELVAAIPGVAGVQAVGEFAILLGENGAGNFIDQVRIDNNGVFTDLLSSSVLFATTPELTALVVVNEINAGNATHGYISSTKYGKVFIGARVSEGSSANGRVVEVVAKGAIVLANGKFSITGSAGGGNEVTSVVVNGLTVTSGAVAWATSDANTASLVAANIRAFASSPKINAVALGNTVYVSPEKIRSNDPVQLSMIVTTAGTVVGNPGAEAPVENDYPDYPDPPRPGFPPNQVP